MQVTKEERDKLRAVDNRVLVAILEKELDNALKVLKMSPEHGAIRWNQGLVYIVEEVLNVIK